TGLAGAPGFRRVVHIALSFAT
ncbi:MAG: hypothetical protein RI920_303, partial [Pseudomonadota bacterium]